MMYVAEQDLGATQGHLNGSPFTNKVKPLVTVMDDPVERKRDLQYAFEFMVIELPGGTTISVYWSGTIPQDQLLTSSQAPVAGPIHCEVNFKI